MGCSTFANFTVLPEIAVAKIREDAPFDKVCYIGCGVTTGVGAVVNTAKVRSAPTSSCSASAASASTCCRARDAGRDKIIGVDINPDREEWGRALRHDRLRQPEGSRRDLETHRIAILALTDRRRRLHLRLHRQHRGDAQALEACHRGWGNPSSSAWPRRARRSPRARSSSSPAATGAARRSAARGPHRRAQDRRLVHERQDRDRPDDHPRPERWTRSTRAST
jgi:S-(hydroxymethyl)glutathione dehydrogenase/alcohol dehydrogenase